MLGKKRRPCFLALLPVALSYAEAATLKQLNHQGSVRRCPWSLLNGGTCHAGTTGKERGLCTILC